MALGLATLVQSLERRRWAGAAGIVSLICLAEQGVTTETFDAIANRVKIDGIARQIDRDCAVFYYHPCDDDPPSHYELDAMWASLVIGMPTSTDIPGMLLGIRGGRRSSAGYRPAKEILNMFLLLSGLSLKLIVVPRLIGERSTRIGNGPRGYHRSHPVDRAGLPTQETFSIRRRPQLPLVS